MTSAPKTISNYRELCDFIDEMFKSPTLSGFTVETTFVGFVRVRKDCDGAVRIFTRVNPADDLVGSN
jgi:hypothetical protein